MKATKNAMVKSCRLRAERMSLQLSAGMGRTHRTLHKVLVGEISCIRFVAPLTSEGSNASVYFIGGFILPFLLGLALLEVSVLDLGTSHRDLAWRHIPRPVRL